MKTFLSTQNDTNISILGDQVLGVTLQDTVVSNLSEDIVITFVHEPIKVRIIFHLYSIRDVIIYFVMLSCITCAKNPLYILYHLYQVSHL